MVEMIFGARHFHRFVSFTSNRFDSLAIYGMSENISQTFIMLYSRSDSFGEKKILIIAFIANV